SGAISTATLPATSQRRRAWRDDHCLTEGRRSGAWCASADFPALSAEGLGASACFLMVSASCVRRGASSSPARRYVTPSSDHPPPPTAPYDWTSGSAAPSPFSA